MGIFNFLIKKKNQFTEEEKKELLAYLEERQKYQKIQEKIRKLKYFLSLVVEKKGNINKEASDIRDGISRKRTEAKNRLDKLNKKWPCLIQAWLKK